MADEKLIGRIRDFELHGQSTCYGVEHAGVVRVVHLQRERLGAPGYLERECRDVACDERVGSGNLRAQLDSIGAHDAEQRRTLLV